MNVTSVEESIGSAQTFQNSSHLHSGPRVLLCQDILHDWIPSGICSLHCPLGIVRQGVSCPNSQGAEHGERGADLDRSELRKAGWLWRWSLRGRALAIRVLPIYVRPRFVGRLTIHIGQRRAPSRSLFHLAKRMAV